MWSVAIGFRSRERAGDLFALLMACATTTLGCGDDAGSTVLAPDPAQPPPVVNASPNPAEPAGGEAAPGPVGTTVGGTGQTTGGNAPGSGTSGASADAGSEPSAADHPGTPPEVSRSWHEWPLPGKDYNNSRYTKASPISSANVGELEEAWRVELPGLVIAYGLVSTVPLIVDGTVYIEDLSSAVRAIELESGRVKWAAPGNGFNPGPNGVAVGWGKVFAIRGSESVVAYDAMTGRELWAKNVVDTATAGIDIQPTVFDGRVLVSTVPISTRGIYVGGDRGILKALDQETGEERWRFDTIATPDDVWSNSGVNSGGGSWFPPAIDVESGRVFWAVANPAPFPGTTSFPNGSSRPGENLYTDSTLALDGRDGTYQWHHQTIQHDLFDRDLLHTMLTEVDGVPLVVSTGKEGRVWAYRRDTGEVRWGPVFVGAHQNDDLTELSGSTRVLPGSFGGVITPPALADGVAFFATLNAPTTYRPNQTAYFGSEIGTMDGSLAAIDVATGEILWEVAVEGDPTGGVTVINDLVFTATFQGDVFAFGRERGEAVWRWRAPGGINSWMSVSGNTLVIPVGSANPAVVVALRVEGAVDGGGPGVDGGQNAASDASSFSSIYADIIAPKCAGPLCHSSSSTGGGLVIGAGASASTVRNALVNGAARGTACASSGLALVVAGNPDASLLYRKLAGTPPCGGRMPPTGALTAQEVGRIRRWIEGGAAND